MGVDFSESSKSTEQKNGLNFFFHLRPSEDAEAGGGCLVKEADFETKKKYLKKKLAFQLCFYVLWQFSH